MAVFQVSCLVAMGFALGNLFQIALRDGGPVWFASGVCVALVILAIAAKPWTEPE